MRFLNFMKYVLVVEITSSFSVQSNCYDWQYFKGSNYHVIVHILITFSPYSSVITFNRYSVYAYIYTHIYVFSRKPVAI